PLARGRAGRDDRSSPALEQPARGRRRVLEQIERRAGGRLDRRHPGRGARACPQVGDQWKERTPPLFILEHRMKRERRERQGLRGWFGRARRLRRGNGLRDAGGIGNAAAPGADGRRRRRDARGSGWSGWGGRQTGRRNQRRRTRLRDLVATDEFILDARDGARLALPLLEDL